MHEKTKYDPRNKIWFWAALISSWLSFIIFFTWPLGLLFWFIVLIVLFIRKTKLKWYLIGFSAWTIIPTLSFLSGTKDYFTGQATFKYVGLPAPEFYNLDRQFRAWNSTSGCVVMGFEPLTQSPNNWAIKFWTNSFGFQKGVYTGSYPDDTLANKMIDSLGQETGFSKNKMTFKFYLAGKEYKISETARYRGMQNLDSCKSAKVALIDNDLILFKPTIVSDDKKVTYLADNKTGQIFARYYEYRKGTTY
jgi:hypothetical protein